MSANTALSAKAPEKTCAWPRSGIKMAKALNEDTLSLEDQRAALLTQVHHRFTELMSGPPDRQRMREAQQWMGLWTQLYAVEVRHRQKKDSEARRTLREETVIELREDTMPSAVLSKQARRFP